MLVLRMQLTFKDTKPKMLQVLKVVVVIILLDLLIWNWGPHPAMLRT